MQDETSVFDTPLTDLSKEEWVNAIAQASKKHGNFEVLGKNHFSAYVKAKPVLLVTFETVGGIRKHSPSAQPYGWEFAKLEGWSSLSIICDGQTWFRDPEIYGLFDRLIDDGFFDEFEKVVFYGSESCGYAASAFSVAAPGSTVVAVRPQATLDPRLTEWDDRFIKMRRMDFTSRYGYAPDMLDAAEQAFVLYDPYIDMDAAHAAMFTRSNVKKLRLPNMGHDLHREMVKMDILAPLIKAAADDNLTTLGFAKLMRARRDNRAYLYRLMRRLDSKNRDTLTIMLCEHATSRFRASRFAGKLAKLKPQSPQD
jgi:hypothetical protein